MSRWYWRDGTLAIDTERDPDWLSKMKPMNEKLCDLEYKVVKQETLPNGRRISTVWLGLDHTFDLGRPLIFETMVFSSDESDGDCERYSTEAEAIEGHERMKARWA